MAGLVILLRDLQPSLDQADVDLRRLLEGVQHIRQPNLALSLFLRCIFSGGGLGALHRSLD